MESRAVAELVLHLGRIASGDGLSAGLTPGQWAILRYFARANRFSRTPSAFAAFHGTTRGTASQAIKGLVAQGYLRQTRSRTDGRSVRLDLTDKATAVLGDDPVDALAEAADGLPPGVRAQLLKTLRRLQGQLAATARKPLFGTCGTCAHFEGSRCCRDGRAEPACGFMNEPLTEAELDELCINFSPGTSPRAPAIGAA